MSIEIPCQEGVPVCGFPSVAPHRRRASASPAGAGFGFSANHGCFQEPRDWEGSWDVCFPPRPEERHRKRVWSDNLAFFEHFVQTPRLVWCRQLRRLDQRRFCAELHARKELISLELMNLAGSRLSNCCSEEGARSPMPMEEKWKTFENHQAAFVRPSVGNYLKSAVPHNRG